MIIKQLSVFLQNELGRLEEATAVLAQQKINISALSIAETSDYGILRMIVDDVEKAAQALRDADFSVKLTDVIRIEAPDVPGSLHDVLTKLSKNGIDLSYMYGYSNDGIAPFILKVSNPEKALEALK
ncbi:MAG: ACT domain-containing protein [Anaerovorax sp.]